MTGKGSRYARKRGAREDREASGPLPEESAGPHLTAEGLEEWPDGTYVVRRLTGSASTKAYRCPGCDHEIRPATPHVVAWPDGALDDRRHWHTPCWRARLRRR